MLSIFNFSKRIRNDFSAVGLDMHSHILWGLDDGAPDLAQSLSLVNSLADMGFKKLIASPHSMNAIYPNTAESIQPKADELQKLLPAGISLGWSPEYFLDEFFLTNLNADNLTPLPGKRLLIEFSMITYPRHFSDFIFDIQTRGYQIVLAHPERYMFAHKDISFFDSLKEMGIEFQLNALSLAGYYGPQVRKVAELLIDKGWIDLLGTDVHHEKHITALRQVPDLGYYRKLVGAGVLRNNELI